MSIGTPGLVLSKDDVRAHETLTLSSLLCHSMYSVPFFGHTARNKEDVQHLEGVRAICSPLSMCFDFCGEGCREQEFDIDHFSIAICQ